VADLSICPACGSDLVQPLRWQARGGGEHELDLRCPECYSLMRGRFEAADVEALDQTLRAAREKISANYEERVRENMEALADCLKRALALDLVSADDFAMPRQARAA
jgi:hypothetical protein